MNAPVAWYEEPCGTCICGDPVLRNEPRRGVEFRDRHVICHLYCAPAERKSELPAPFMYR